MVMSKKRIDQVLEIPSLLASSRDKVRKFRFFYNVRVDIDCYFFYLANQWNILYRLVVAFRYRLVASTLLRSSSSNHFASFLLCHMNSAYGAGYDVSQMILISYKP
ncbi:hypothetical protein D918_00527 [Trichuris suis]|nr:hypothetical protein D918_00527 [Trichuris suis]